ncbi:Peroxidase [Rhynchospora pubera]|uniref:Peroxidase n=1 Tax=Rhynchospora pubera TaxID=906938 RepID=A0AAV8HZK9_9POAL|nr:Peroxidase [Rhynchospora pubera]
MRSCFVIALVWCVLFLGCSVEAQLKVGFYKKSCPQVEQIVAKVIAQKMPSNPELAARLIRLFFHDCFVRGCDASLLIDSTASNTAEKEAPPNLTVAGYEVIDEIKAAVEAACPGIVSCADIVALSARDSVSFPFNKPLWEVQTGRRDGTISLASEARTNIPAPFFTYSRLVSSFANKSLSVQDLVVLSGAHTIGIAHCNSFSTRLFNFTGQNNVNDFDPSLDLTYLRSLQQICQNLANNVTSVPMDPTTSTTFDSHYYSNLKLHKGLFTSDAALLTDSRASNLVDKLVDEGNFLDAFKNSIKRMGAIEVLTGTAGEIRKNCRVINS